MIRPAFGLDVDKSDLKRLDGSIGRKPFDLLLVGQAAAKENDRNFIYPWDLPLTTHNARQHRPTPTPWLSGSSPAEAAT